MKLPRRALRRRPATGSLKPITRIARTSQPNLVAGLNPSKFNARGQAILAGMRASGTPISAMAVPKLSDVGRMLTGGRAGVPRHVSPVKPVALNSIIPNMVRQSEAGQAVGGALRRLNLFPGARAARSLSKPRPPRPRGGSARTM